MFQLVRQGSGADVVSLAPLCRPIMLPCTRGQSGAESALQTRALSLTNGCERKSGTLPFQRPATWRKCAIHPLAKPLLCTCSEDIDVERKRRGKEKMLLASTWKWSTIYEKPMQQERAAVPTGSRKAASMEAKSTNVTGYDCCDSDSLFAFFLGTRIVKSSRMR